MLKSSGVSGEPFLLSDPELNAIFDATTKFIHNTKLLRSTNAFASTTTALQATLRFDNFFSQQSRINHFASLQ